MRSTRSLSAGLIVPVLALLASAACAACGAPRPDPASPADKAGGAVAGCAGASAILAEIEALRQARGAGEDLADVLRAERALVDAARVRRSRAPEVNATFGEVEAEADKRIAAAVRVSEALAQPRNDAESAVAQLSTACQLARLAPAATKTKPAKAMTAVRADCERFAQLIAGGSWDDTKKVAQVASGLASLTALEGAKDTAAKVQRLFAAHGATAAERKLLAEPRGGASVETEATARWGACESSPARELRLAVAKDPSPRALTVLIAAKPPGDLARRFLYAAEQDASQAGLYRGAAAGRFGSGFVLVVNGENGAREPYVVTNRHVADLASAVTLALEDGRHVEARVAFVDPTYDVAVLAPAPGPIATQLAERGGFALATRSAKDGDEVTATGYPGLLGTPSFQLSKGHVSNEKLPFGDGTSPKLIHVQHTAAIDPGSSGGPLLGARREVLGVNTFKLVNREAVSIAVPAEAVARALVSARTARTCEGACRKRAAEDACLALVTELGRREPSATSVERLLGQEMIASYGIESHNELVRSDGTIFTRFQHAPVATLSEAVARRVVETSEEAGGLDPLETCGGVRMLKLAPDATSFGAPIAFRNQVWNVSFAWDGARFRVSDFPLPETEPEAEPAPATPAPKAAPKPATKPASRPAAPAVKPTPASGKKTK